jgi:hypothetical protein
MFEDAAVVEARFTVSAAFLEVSVLRFAVDEGSMLLRREGSSVAFVGGCTVIGAGGIGALESALGVAARGCSSGGLSPELVEVVVIEVGTVVVVEGVLVGNSVALTLLGAVDGGGYVTGAGYVVVGVVVTGGGDTDNLGDCGCGCIICGCCCT